MGILCEAVGDQAAETVVTDAHVDRIKGHKHASGRTRCNHRDEVVAAKVGRNSASLRQNPAGISKTEPPARVKRKGFCCCGFGAKAGRNRETLWDSRLKK